MSRFLCALVVTMGVSACLAQQRAVTDRSTKTDPVANQTGTVTLLNTGMLLVKTGGEMKWDEAGNLTLVSLSHTVAYEFADVTGLSLVYCDGKYQLDRDGESLEEIQANMQRSLSVTPLDRIDDGDTAYSIMTVEGEIAIVADGDVTELSVVADGTTIASFTFTTQPETAGVQSESLGLATAGKANCSAGPCGNPETGSTCTQSCNKDQACISFCRGVTAVCDCVAKPQPIDG